MSDKIIFCDIDDVVADLLSEWLRWYNLDYDGCLTPKDIHEWDLSKRVKQSCGIKIYDYLNNPAIYDNVKPIQYSLYGVNQLRQFGYRVIFATATPRTTPYRKFDWLEEHGFKPEMKDYIEIRDKSLLNGDILLDDKVENVSNFKGKGVLFNQPHNEYYLFPITRVNGWKDFIHNYILGGDK